MTRALHYSVRNSEKLSRPKGKRSRTGERPKNQSLIVTLQTKKNFEDDCS